MKLLVAGLLLSGLGAIGLVVSFAIRDPESPDIGLGFVILVSGVAAAAGLGILTLIARRL